MAVNTERYDAQLEESSIEKLGNLSDALKTAFVGNTTLFENHAETQNYSKQKNKNTVIIFCKKIFIVRVANIALRESLFKMNAYTRLFICTEKNYTSGKINLFSVL